MTESVSCSSWKRGYLARRARTVGEGKRSHGTDLEESARCLPLLCRSHTLTMQGLMESCLVPLQMGTRKAHLKGAALGGPNLQTVCDADTEINWQLKVNQARLDLYCILEHGCIWAFEVFSVFDNSLWQTQVSLLGESSNSDPFHSPLCSPSRSSRYLTGCVARYFASLVLSLCQSAEMFWRWNCKWNSKSCAWKEHSKSLERWRQQTSR